MENYIKSVLNHPTMVYVSGIATGFSCVFFIFTDDFFNKNFKLGSFLALYGLSTFGLTFLPQSKHYIVSIPNMLLLLFAYFW